MQTAVHSDSGDEIVKTASMIWHRVPRHYGFGLLSLSFPCWGFQVVTEVLAQAACSFAQQMIRVKLKLATGNISREGS